ncbi:MAG: hypothetical protein AB1Z98_17615 [Nannocystaceae bacterium]
MAWPPAFPSHYFDGTRHKGATCMTRHLLATGLACILLVPTSCADDLDADSLSLRGAHPDDEEDQYYSGTYRNPARRGKYRVGSRTVFIQDFDRPFDQWGQTYGTPAYQQLLADLEAIGEPRSLVTEIWYPVRPLDAPGHPRATYLDYYGGDRAIFDRRGVDPDYLTADGTTVGELQQTDTVAHEQLVEGVLDELASRKRRSRVGAPVAPGRFPLVILSHGAFIDETTPNANREVWTTEAERLASHGYIVVAMNHTGDSRHSVVFHHPNSLLAQQGPPEAVTDAYEIMFTEPGIPDKLFAVLFDPSQGPVAMNEMFQRLFEQRADDAASVIDYMTGLDGDPGDPLCGHVDIDEIGMAGFSLGSITTQVALNTIPEIDVGIGWNNGIPTGWEPPSFTGQTKPILLTLGTQDALTRTIFTELPFLIYPTVVPGGDPSDIMLSPQERVFPPTVDNPEPVVRAAYDRAQGPKMLLELIDLQHWDVTDGENYLFPRHRLEQGAIDVAFDSVLERLPFGADVLDPQFTGDHFEVLGWERKKPWRPWRYSPHRIRSYYSVAWFGYYLKGELRYRDDLLDDRFGSDTRVFRQGI